MIKVNHPFNTAIFTRGKLAAIKLNKGNQKQSEYEVPLYSSHDITMPVGTIFLNYEPDGSWKDAISGTLYCLVPEWQIDEV